MGSVGTTSSFCVIGLLLGEDNSWTSVRVYYFVSSRNDFFIGTFSAGTSANNLVTYLLQKYAPGNSVSLVNVLPNWTSSQENFTAVAQISGLRTTASTYSVSLGSSTFSASSG